MAKAAKKNEISEDDYNSAVFEGGSGLVVDLSGIEAMSFEAVPKGIYAATIEECNFEISKNSGAPMFSMVIRIDGGDYDGRTHYYYTSFSPKALPSTKTTLLRIDPTLFAGQFEPQKVAEEGTLLGKPVRIKIGHEDYQGENRSRIQGILAPAADGGQGASQGSGGGFFND